MCTSDTEVCLHSAKIALAYLVISVLCIVFGAIYELFGHEVYSWFMIYAFLFPLCGGVFPYMMFCLVSKEPLPGECDRTMGHLGIATLTMGSIVSGVLEIYGTTNQLTCVYWLVGMLFFLGFVFRVQSYFVPSTVDGIDTVLCDHDLLPACTFAKAWTTRVRIVEADAENAICYELTLVDDNENKVFLPEKAEVVLPYPQGMTFADAKECEFVVIHEAKSNVEIYSTQSGTLKRIECGLELTVPSFSPLRIT